MAAIRVCADRSPSNPPLQSAQIFSLCSRRDSTPAQNIPRMRRRHALEIQISRAAPEFPATDPPNLSQSFPASPPPSRYPPALLASPERSHPFFRATHTPPLQMAV